MFILSILFLFISFWQLTSFKGRKLLEVSKRNYYSNKPQRKPSFTEYLIIFLRNSFLWLSRIKFLGFINFCILFSLSAFSNWIFQNTIWANIWLYIIYALILIPYIGLCLCLLTDDRFQHPFIVFIKEKDPLLNKSFFLLLMVWLLLIILMYLFLIFWGNIQ